MSRSPRYSSCNAVVSSTSAVSSWMLAAMASTNRAAWKRRVVEWPTVGALWRACSASDELDVVDRADGEQSRLRFLGDRHDFLHMLLDVVAAEHRLEMLGAGPLCVVDHPDAVEAGVDVGRAEPRDVDEEGRRGAVERFDQFDLALCYDGEDVDEGDARGVHGDRGVRRAEHDQSPILGC